MALTLSGTECHCHLVATAEAIAGAKIRPLHSNEDRVSAQKDKDVLRTMTQNFARFLLADFQTSPHMIMTDCHVSNNIHMAQHKNE